MILLAESVGELSVVATLLALVGLVVRHLLRSDSKRDGQLATTLQNLLKQADEQHQERSRQRERELAEMVRLHKDKQQELALMRAALVDVRHQMVRLVVLIAREKASTPAEVLQIVDAVMAAERPQHPGLKQ